MPRFLFQSPDDETGTTIETDWLELPDVASACAAADEVVREAAMEFVGPGVVRVIVYDSEGAAVHRAEVEIRNPPCGRLS